MVRFFMLIILWSSWLQARTVSICKLDNRNSKICIGDYVFTESGNGLPFEIDAGTIIKFQENDSVQVVNRVTGDRKTISINELFLTNKTLKLGSSFKGRDLSAGENIIFQTNVIYASEEAKILAVRGDQVAVQVGCLDDKEVRCYATRKILTPNNLPSLYLTSGCIEGVNGTFCVNDSYVDLIYGYKLEIVGLSPEYAYGQFEGTIAPFGKIDRSSMVKKESP